MKKSIGLTLVLFTTLTFLFYLVLPVSADMGPKPSVTVQVVGFEKGEEFGVCFLGNANGPHREWEGDDEAFEALDPVSQKLILYKDSDSMGAIPDSLKVYTSEDTKVTESVALYEGYYPVNPFKVLIYIPSKDTYLVTDIIETKGFESVYRVDLSGAVDGKLEAHDLHTLKDSVSGIAIRWGLTVVLELGIAFLFLLGSKRNALIIFLVNTVTNLALNIFLGVKYFERGGWAFAPYGKLELIICSVEFLLFAFLLKTNRKHPKIRILLYTIAANLVTYLVGFLTISKF